MAPRGGGRISFGVGGDGGSSSCEYCDAPLELGGSNWKNPTVNALFAFNIITALALLVCMFLTRRFKWIRQKGTDKLRNFGYLVATFALFCYFVFQITATALGETNYVTTYLFYIVYMLEDAFYRLGEVLILAIIARTITEDLGILFARITRFFVTIFALIAGATSGFVIAEYAGIIANGQIDEVPYLGARYLTITYASYLFVLTLCLAILAFMAIFKRSAMGTYLMLLVVIPSLFLKNLLGLALEAIEFQPSRSNMAALDLSYASSFISDLAIIAIFVTVALIGGLRQRQTDSGISQEQKLSQPGPHYVALGPYAAPAPYAPHGTQLPAGQPDTTSQYQNPGQYATQGQYVAPGQPQPQTQYSQPVQYAAPVQPVQQGQYAPQGQYAAPGQYAPQQGQYGGQPDPSTTPSPAARAVSPVHYAPPPAVSPAPYGAPTASSISPPPPHDPYQMHIVHQ